MSKANLKPAESQALLASILVHAADEKEQWWAFGQWFQEKLHYPLHGFALGEPVFVNEIDYDGNPRRVPSRKHAVVDVGPQDRAVTLAEQMQQADDLDRKYKVNDLLEVLHPAAMTRKALANFWEWKKVEEVSLRELMDMAIVEEADPKPGYMVTQLLDLRCVGIKGFWSVVNRLTALDLGARCNAEWSRRRIKLEGCCRVYGVRHGWSKPLAPDAKD